VTVLDDRGGDDDRGASRDRTAAEHPCLPTHPLPTGMIQHAFDKASANELKAGMREASVGLAG
jgi:hypothetical protein